MSSSNHVEAKQTQPCIHANLYTKIKTVYLNGYIAIHKGKTYDLTGYALFDTLRGELIRIGGDLPYLPAGGRSGCETIVASGLVGVPDLYVSSQAQRKRIFTAKKYRSKSK